MTGIAPFLMQTKHVLLFVALAGLVGEVVSMTTSRVFAAQTNNSNIISNTNTAADSSTQSEFVKEKLIDDDKEL